MKKLFFVILCSFILLSGLLVSCDGTVDEKLFGAKPSWNKEDYMLKGGRNDNGTSSDYSDDYLEWFEGFGLEWHFNGGNTTVQEIEFTSTKPSVYTTECDLTVKNNGNVMGYCNSDGSKIWIVGEHFVGNPNSSNYFHFFTELTTIKNINLLDTSEITDMNLMFHRCEKLTSLNLYGWDTSNVTSMVYMFGWCFDLTSLTGLSEWNTSKVADMQYMFNGCQKLTSLDLSNWTMNANSYPTYSNMFSDCGQSGTTIKINPAYKTGFFDTTELGSSPWNYSSGVYTKQ